MTVLSSALAAALAIACIEIVRLRIALRRSAHLASHDALTGLLNRFGFKKRLQAALKRNQGLAILSLDIDQLKKVNDKYGHHKGDLIIKEIAVRIAGAAGSRTVAARLGGDEFVMFQEGMTEAQATALASHLLYVLNSTLGPYSIDVKLTCSIGIAMIGTHARLDEALHAADEAMYRAKERGGDMFIFSGEHETP